MSDDKVEFEIQSEESQTETKTPEPELEIIDDTPEKDRGRKPMEEPPKEFSEDEISQYHESVQKRIKHFTKGYHEERRAKEAALREREEALKLAQSIIEENKRLKSTVSENQQALLEQAKRVTAQELEKAKEEFRKAYDMGDSEALASAQENLTSAKIKAERVANFTLPSLQQEEPALQIPQAPKQQPDQRAEKWRNDNQWFGQDRRMTAYALSLHDELTSVEHIDPTSDEYYRKIDAEMRERFPDRFDSDAPPPKKSTVVAPATRSTASKKIVLTQTQVNIARRLGLSPEAYAKEVAKLNRGNV
ncbi:MAG: hypothetical protein RL156_1718 [Bacteroidota bacterium]|jgi:hypothetical protein